MQWTVQNVVSSYMLACDMVFLGNKVMSLLACTCSLQLEVADQ